MDVIFFTVGCRLNQIESESAARFFVEKSFSVSLVPLNAKSPVDYDTQLAVINTCAVTQKAEQKDRRMIRLILEKCPNACVVVTGCYAQLSKPQILSINSRIAVLKGLLKSRITEVSSLLQKQIENSPEKRINPVEFAEFLNEKIFSSRENSVKVSENPFKLSTDSFLAHSRPSIKIQDGCNSSCSYCTIHIARGSSVSLSPSEVVMRVLNLEKFGYAEVVFTTVNISQYRGEYNGEILDFPHLLDLCIKKTSKIAFRISSLYPEVIDDFFCSVISSSRVRPHFHISVQSGSNKILLAMGRKYLREDVIEACRKLNDAKLNPFIASDIITGFPGETDEDFDLTMDLCRKCNFSYVHVFPFSERKNTPASTMKNKVPQYVRDERAKKLSLLALKNKEEYIKKCENKVFDAVLETVKDEMYKILPSGKKVFHAVTENFLHCMITAEKDFDAPPQGSSVKLRILPDSVFNLSESEIEVEAEFV